MTIAFPFERNRRYRLAELREFERLVREERSLDPALSAQLRAPSASAPQWMALRLKELLPLKLYADQTKLGDHETFLIMPEGDAVDAIVTSRDDTIKLQLTLAAPIWGNSPETNSGYQHHQVMVALNQAKVVSGWPPFHIRDEVAYGEIQSLKGDDRDIACLSGLVAALRRKALFDGRGCTLAILARDFYLNLLELPLFEEIVGRALEAQPVAFDSVAVFDSEPSFFVEHHFHV